MLSEADHVQERTVAHLCLLQPRPSKVQQAAGHKPRLVQCLVQVGEQSLRRRLEQVEFTVLEQDALFDELEDILDLLLGAERALQDVAIGHLDTDFGARVVGLALDSFKL